MGISVNVVLFRSVVFEVEFASTEMLRPVGYDKQPVDVLIVTKLALDHSCEFD